MKYIYLIRHSSPFVEIENYNDYKNVLWDEYNKNMILSVEGEEKAKKLCDIKELKNIKNIKNIYSSNSFRAIGTAKYLSELNTPNEIMGICYKKKEENISGNILILDNIQDPGNLGTIIRSASILYFYYNS